MNLLASSMRAKIWDFTRLIIKGYESRRNTTLVLTYPNYLPTNLVDVYAGDAIERNYCFMSRLWVRIELAGGDRQQEQQQQLRKLHDGPVICIEDIFKTHQLYLITSFLIRNKRLLKLFTKSWSNGLSITATARSWWFNFNSDVHRMNHSNPYTGFLFVVFIIVIVL